MAFSQGARSLTAEGRERVIKDYNVIKPKLLQAGDDFHIQAASAGLAQQEFFSSLQEYLKKMEQGTNQPLLKFIEDLSLHFDRVNTNFFSPDAFSAILHQALSIRDVRLVSELNMALSAWEKLLELQKILAGRKVDIFYIYKQLAQKIKLSLSIQDTAQRRKLIVQMMEIMRKRKPLCEELDFDPSVLPQGNLTAEEFQTLILEGADKKIKALSDANKKEDETINQFFDSLIQEIKNNWSLSSQPELRNQPKIIENLKQHLIKTTQQYRKEGRPESAIRAFLVQEGVSFVAKGNQQQMQQASYLPPSPINPHYRQDEKEESKEPLPPSYDQACLAPSLSPNAVIPTQPIYPAHVSVDSFGRLIHVEQNRNARATVSTVVDNSNNKKDSPSNSSRASNGSNSSGSDEKESPNAAQHKLTNGVGNLGVFGSHAKSQQNAMPPAFNPEYVLAEKQQQSNFMAQSGGGLQGHAAMFQKELSKEEIAVKLKELEAIFVLKDDECKLLRKRQLDLLDQGEIKLYRDAKGKCEIIEKELDEIMDQHRDYRYKCDYGPDETRPLALTQIFSERFSKSEHRGNPCCAVM